MRLLNKNFIEVKPDQTNQNKYFICWCDKVSFRLFLFHFRIGNKKQQLQEHKTVQNRLNKNRSRTEKIVTNTHTGKKQLQIIDHDSMVHVFPPPPLPPLIHTRLKKRKLKQSFHWWFCCIRVQYRGKFNSEHLLLVLATRMITILYLTWYRVPYCLERVIILDHFSSLLWSLKHCWSPSY